jgi:hypothetical protein
VAGRIPKQSQHIAGSEYLKFTCGVWQPGPTDDEVMLDEVSVLLSENFPYLDMEMFWTENEERNFKVHLKPNQELKYLNRWSNHTKATFKAIPHGVLSRLAKLTTMMEENENMRMNAYILNTLLLLRKQNSHLRNGLAKNK